MTTTVCKRRNLTTWPTCNCAPCQATRYKLAKLSRNGKFDRVPSERGMAALQKMMNAGMAASAIADATGIGENTISNWLAKLRAGHTFRLGAKPCALLVAARIPENGMVGTTGPRRMLQALARMGWSCDELTRRIRANGNEIGTNTLHAIRVGKTDRVRAWVANAITSLYQDLEMTPGGSKQTVSLAIANRWPGPLAWDEDTIGNPDTEPQGVPTSSWQPGVIDESRIERRINGDRTVRLHKGETVEVVRRMLAAGHSQTAIQRLTGVKAERYMPEIRAERQEAAA